MDEFIFIKSSMESRVVFGFYLFHMSKAALTLNLRQKELVRYLQEFSTNLFSSSEYTNLLQNGP